MAPAGVRAIPTFFRPQFQKHAGEICGGVELVVTEAAAVRSFELGVRLVASLALRWPKQFRSRRDPYEFDIDPPAIDLLVGSPRLRELIESGATAEVVESGLDRWIAGWEAEERRFLVERRPFCRSGG
jgi:uncharacterized protein YbbC (DUF1343 family)